MSGKIAETVSTLSALNAAAVESGLFVDDYGALFVVPVDTAGSSIVNKDVALLASAARTATVNTTDQTNLAHRGAVVTIDCTASAATPSVVFTIQGKDAAGTYYTILASAAVTGTSTTVLKVYPGLVAAANSAADHPLPLTWRVNCVHADADSITYSVSASLII